MKKTLTLSLTLAATLFSAQASNISVIDFAQPVVGGPVIQNQVTLDNGGNLTNAPQGTPLPNAGSRVRVGYFNTSAQGATWLSDLRSNNVDLINSALQSFIPLGENAAAPNLGTVPTTAGPRFAQRTIDQVSRAGRLAGQIELVNPVAAPANSVNAGGVPNGSRIFMLVYSDNNSTLAFGEEFGVFSADNWLMPSDGGLNLSLNTTDVDTAGEVFRGTFGSLKLAPIVPEPATGAMALLAGLGLLARRRR
jgi:hypothetical protein